jgi:hypothetical protein
MLTLKKILELTSHNLRCIIEPHDYSDNPTILIVSIQDVDREWMNQRTKVYTENFNEAAKDLVIATTLDNLHKSLLREVEEGLIQEPQEESQEQSDD